jgi:hypothetical protein
MANSLIGTPLSKTLVLAVESNAVTQSIHGPEKPRCRNTSNRNDQATESKSCAISTLSSNEVHFLVSKRLTVYYTYL